MNSIIELFGIVFPFIILIFSIIAHEVAHGLAAYIHGDNTAHDQGRLTLNPIPHIDLIGSIIVPLFSVMFTNYSLGWAKPVPYNPHNLRGRFAESWVASAGILTNFLIAGIAVLVFKNLHLFGVDPAAFSDLFLLIVWINVSLGFFNLIPVPPFDGMSILESFFPRLRLTTRRFAQGSLYLIVVIFISATLFSSLSPYLFIGVKALLS